MSCDVQVGLEARAIMRTQCGRTGRDGHGNELPLAVRQRDSAREVVGGRSVVPGITQLEVAILARHETAVS